jgi:hypothetical protein
MVLASPGDVPPNSPAPSTNDDAPSPPSGRPVLRRVK